ncbi:MAG TPA: DinB family protein [Cyclobacteriaceae bacterium]|nr:DinB family protein [Cyclobacteriaceae bacterium]
MKTSPDFTTLPEFYKNYVSHVQDLNVMEALQTSISQTTALLQGIDETKGEYRYAPGKWSIKELLCHMMDAERIFAYRALRFSRNDATPLSGFEENDYAPQANAHSRTIKQLIVEMKNLRATSVDLFASMTPDMLQRKGTANNKLISVINIGYIIAGHETHHRNILTERYLKK